MSYINGKFLHRCSWCHDEKRTHRTAPLTPTRTTTPASTRNYNREYWARLDALERGDGWSGASAPMSQKPAPPEPVRESIFGVYDGGMTISEPKRIKSR